MHKIIRIQIKLIIYLSTRLLRLEHLLAVAALELGGLVRPHVDIEGMLPPKVLPALFALEGLRWMRLDLAMEMYANQDSVIEINWLSFELLR